MNGISAAHRELPLGTIIRVTHLGNGKSIIVKVNDRGPFIKGRILDLSLGAAKKLDMVDEGVAKVKSKLSNQLINPPPHPNIHTYPQSHHQSGRGVFPHRE